MTTIYEQVTHQMIAALEAGTPPWIRPWSGEAEPVPVNAGSRRPYRGINTILLTLVGQLHGYSRNGWLTYRQARELGGQVRGGEHGATVVFFKRPEPEAQAEVPEGDGTEQKRAGPLLRTFRVFNLAQIDGLPEHIAQPAAPAAWDPLEAAERLLAESGAAIQHGGFAAFYRPADDTIHLPERGCFATAEEYYATATHELAHWTGHETRCNRQLGRRFGEEAYAAEEMIAEMASAFVCAHLHIEGRLQHASYVEHWLRVLRGDKRAVFTAAAKAQQAADYLLARDGERCGAAEREAA